jgi:hypothetical protein
MDYLKGSLLYARKADSERSFVYLFHCRVSFSYKIMLPCNIWVGYLKLYVAYFLKFHIAFPVMLKINFTLVRGSCLRSSGVAVQCGMLLQPMVVKDICIKFLFLLHPRCWFRATEVTSNIVFNCYLCLCSLPLDIEKEQIKIVTQGGLCQTKNKHVKDGGMRRKLWWGIWL